MDDDQTHATNIEYTLKELQRRIRENETELSKLQATHIETSLSPAAQTEVIATALRNVTESEPFLPFPGSVLPALLALRRTHAVITESKVLAENQGVENETETRRLEADKSALRDQNLLTEALELRLQSLREELNSNADIHQEDAAKQKFDELRKKKTSYDKETSKLMKALLAFIDSQLAAMLAAEELGGPVVGDLVDIDAEDLAGGFNAQGKLKKAARGSTNQDKRQRRLDDIWGIATNSGARQQGLDDEVAAAAMEMRQLTEELLNKLVESQGDNSESYVTLSRESAAARFLIRSKVAQFHPKDASRIRLIDFGRELEE